MESVLNDSKAYIQQRLQQTMLRKGRNHGIVNVQIEPFFKECFKRLFVPVAGKHESWQIQTLKTQKLRKTTITIK